MPENEIELPLSDTQRLAAMICKAYSHPCDKAEKHEEFIMEIADGLYRQGVRPTVQSLQVTEREAAIDAGRAFVEAINRFIGSKETDGVPAHRGLTIVEYREDVLEAIAFLERFNNGRE